ncbi:MAG: ABC transporter substrate-binding protein [Candidatus Cryptobacteroides sp.]|nr:ABC transporter substrate-binding protein [Bacteroidales bacterium]MDY6158458.1 ABC transporter substrate-binding protein [Candidatus Cryptobacteroides sp.]
MKKFFAIMAAALMLCACSEDRSHILKVYNWADYIDEALLGEFEQWYEEQTGEPVKVIYQTFDINETMLSKIELGHEDYDVVCPSDYIIERMLSSDLLLPMDKNFGDTPDYTVNVAPFITSCFDMIEGHGKNANDYSVAYMWGTTGIIYNPKYVTDEEASSWEVLRNPKFAGKILMKDAFRDVYTSMLIAINKDKIASGEKDINTISYDSSDESIAAVEAYLNSFKDAVAGWEADFGKEQMTKERAWINLSWSGDAQWAIEEAAEMGVELRYAVPKEGSTMWFDGWVIPKYAKNVKAASYFINYMCKPENAVRNMEVIGYVSANGGQEILEAMSDPEQYSPIDASYLFGEGAESVCLNPIMYPDAAVIERCGMLHDNGDRTANLLEMWSRVKGDSANVMTYVIVGALVLVLVVAIALRMRGSKRKKHARRR